jgi:Sulfotransferase domain
LSGNIWLWQPDPVALRTALGKALYRAPDGLRAALPRVVRDALRRRVGPFAPWEAGFAHHPPVAGAHEVSGPPDFVGIGMQKAGTTWWFELLAAHPDVTRHPGLHKERHYFAPFATRAFGPEQVEGYHRLFPRPTGKKTGEWTPDYVYQPWVPPLLARAAPEARILVMLRDPVERFVSGLTHSRLTPGSHLGTVVAESVNRGFYAAALARWIPAFDAGRVLVLQYERCVADPGAQLARTYRFLGLDDEFRPAALHRASSPTLEKKVELDGEARARLADLYRSDVTALAGLVPDLDLALWPNFGPA